jgi:hypothetical protein
MTGGGPADQTGTIVESLAGLHDGDRSCPAICDPPCGHGTDVAHCYAQPAALSSNFVEQSHKGAGHGPEKSPDCHTAVQSPSTQSLTQSTGLEPTGWRALQCMYSPINKGHPPLSIGIIFDTYIFPLRPVSDRSYDSLIGHRTSICPRTERMCHRTSGLEGRVESH